MFCLSTVQRALVNLPLIQISGIFTTSNFDYKDTSVLE